MADDAIQLAELIRAYTAAGNTDLFILSGPLDGAHDGNSCHRLAQAILKKESRRENAALFLTTYGGDPDSAFKLARCLRQNYKRFTLLVAGPCKSAGTLVALGAHELAFSPMGELGPLDIQMAKPDELLMSGSGLDIFSALESLTSHAFEKFQSYMLSMTRASGGNVSFRTASDVAVKLITGLIQPIAAHIDPVRLGEAQRAIDIASAYGERLGVDNLRENALKRLVHDYPSHSFVIDLEESKTLFTNVRTFTVEELGLMATAGIVRFPNPTAAIFDMDDYATGEPDNASAPSRPTTGTATQSAQGDEVRPATDEGSGIDQGPSTASPAGAQPAAESN